MVLVGNKADLPNRSVTFEEAKQFSSENDLLFIETSAENGVNVVSAIQLGTEKCVSNLEKGITNITDSSGIRIGSSGRTLYTKNVSSLQDKGSDQGCCRVG